MKDLMVHSRPCFLVVIFHIGFQGIHTDDAADVSMGAVVPIASLVQRGGGGRLCGARAREKIWGDRIMIVSLIDFDRSGCHHALNVAYHSAILCIRAWIRWYWCRSSRVQGSWWCTVGVRHTIKGLVLFWSRCGQCCFYLVIAVQWLVCS